MRSMWKGSISFGLVTIPVKLYAATESKDLKFNLLHQECRTPVQYRKWCPHCDREVSSQEIVKGFEYQQGRYVVMTEEELASVPVAAAHTLEIVDFVELEQIDPIYFDRTYYLEPGEGGARAYALLRRAMAETGRIAIARVVIRTRESLAAIRVFQGGVLALETMHFPEEIRSPAGLTAIAEPELRPQELEMAVNLITSLSGTFEPEKFENRYREAVLDLIEAKVSGEEVVQPEEAPPQGNVVDLMTALRASIQQAEAVRTGSAGAARGSLSEGTAASPGSRGPLQPGLAPSVAVPSRLSPGTSPPAAVPSAVPPGSFPSAPAPSVPGTTASIPGLPTPPVPGVPDALPFAPIPRPSPDAPGTQPEHAP